MTFDEIITPQERAELEHEMSILNRNILRAILVCSMITEWIDAKFDGKA